MQKNLTTEEFITRAKLRHGDKYDYSLVDYKSSTEKVKIICPIHGVFEQAPVSHLRGCGCCECRIDKTKKIQYNRAINDSKPLNRDAKSYRVWKSMFNRCYSDKFHTNFPTYQDCEVCEEWYKYSNFKEWFDKHYVDGWQLDKDILVKGNKVYSPSTCCFVPPSINYLFVKKNACRGDCPIGVTYYNEKYHSSVRIYGKRISLGVYNNPEDAFQAYKKAKENHIKEIALQYFNNGEINQQVYNALMNYEVEITD